MHHDLVRWYRDGVAYVVSVHSSDMDADALLRGVAEHMDYVRDS